MLWITSWEEDREESMAGHPRGRVADSMYQLHFLIPIFCGRTTNRPLQTRYKGKSAKATPPLESKEQKARFAAQEEYRKGKEEAHQRLLEKHSPHPIEGTEHTTESAWSKSHLLFSIAGSKIPHCNPYCSTQHLRHGLERRLYREISNAMKSILGKDLDLEFVVANPE
jgi:hypothetical protein